MEYLCSLLEYDKDTGVITWKERRGRKIRAGSVAGHVNKKGYRCIGFMGSTYSAHRVAAFMIGMEINGLEIDHVNGDRDDNRQCNLRAVATQTNLKNKRTQRNSTTGVNGVSFKAKPQKYAAYVKVSGKDIFLGQFEDKWDAICVRMSANNKYNFHKNHGRL